MLTRHQGVVYLLFHCTFFNTCYERTIRTTNPTAQPIVPFSLKPWQEIGCNVCNFYQDIKYRPDVQAQQGGGPQQIPIQGYGGGPPPQGPGGPQQTHPQYK